ncbi:K01681 aconitate hydratase 1 [Cyberlindnera jadinii]|uniref:Aconitate hydratase, mitochondrial n=1 Tax=Cyberlindnera jadinii (strain ATCC 18201 / CBS 1600 / BCRC 20928 / JCM 3617 / NBRC 0987 / NRRL Y-1542) TaxID=983966 RepID=A0A0H5BZF5_CYBJN|nr:aconitate hydratase mitochondrial precursor [Cyberlindnera jadinii NRRL Y-1542]ODV75875.1 aconitate hydratase mitochondrial precursor [Cyberlindnera jadinii NRRL Y-1542]CEP20577.1 K01681 aconitate hydratase 1 [Cyberlindnera jadinii]
MLRAGRVINRQSIRSLATSASLTTNIPSEFQTRVPPYPKLVEKLTQVKRVLNDAPLTLAEKILYSHLVNPEESLSAGDVSKIRGLEYLKLNPDRVAMQDASAQMALLQFMTCGLPSTAVPASIHCDHLIVGKDGEKADLKSSIATNKEVFDFLQSCGEKYGIQFWGPGSGIIHQIVLENFSAPGLMMLGTDSHTPNAGGLGAIAIGVGGADAVDALTGTPWELKAPKILGVHLKGKMNGWTSPKDIITYLAGYLTVRGGTGFIVEYFGEGVESLSCTGMATICNMGAEIGATTSTFPYQEAHKRYLISTHRAPLAQAADEVNAKFGFLKADPGAQYDKVVEIDLNTLEPHINGPFTPDLSTPLGQFGSKTDENEWPKTVSAGLIGSCTNSSYQDMSRAVSLVKQASEAGLKPKIPFFVTPGSEQIRATIERDGLIETFEDNGAIVLANACGPCIGQWDRVDIDKKSTETNAIFTSFNRNFRARNDGNRNTMNFLTSPEVVTAMIYSGDMHFNPITDSIKTEDGSDFKFQPPKGDELPERGFIAGRPEFYPEVDPQPHPEVAINIPEDSDRLQLLEPWTPWNGEELKNKILLKVEGKCTTDHISAAGVWLKYKGHLENIANNTLIGAQNKETGEVNVAYDDDGTAYSIPELMGKWKEEGIKWNVVAEHNYGEGSAREHAALQPRFLGGEMILVKSFARIHETNLKKQGLLPLTFANEADYDKLSSGDILETLNLKDMIAKNGDNGGIIKLRVHKKNGETFDIDAKHTMSKDQVDFFKAGSAINHIGNVRRAEAGSQA